jgi:hypothetical protein
MTFATSGQVAFLSEKTTPATLRRRNPTKHEHAPDPSPSRALNQRTIIRLPRPTSHFPDPPAFPPPGTRIDANDIGMEVWLEK